MKLPLAFAACLLVPLALHASESDARRELLRVEAELCHAFEVGDADVAKRDLDETFTLTDSHGAVTDYARNVADIEHRDPAYDVFRNHDQNVRLYGDAAIITGITRVKGQAGKAAFDGNFQYTDTWIQRDGRWRLAASHASRLPEKAR